MNTDTQSIRGQQILTALITIFEKHNNQATLEQIYEEVPEFMMEEVEQSDIIQVLRSYTSIQLPASLNQERSPAFSLI